ncbi:MAG TPA: hypothetical protein VN512_02730, partial [Clostridia bacterium]|nr:hypothetical protein [Clostridia bacterium]
MKKRAQTAVAGYDLNRVDKTALAIIWVVIAVIIFQVFLKNTGKQITVTIEALAVGALVTAICFLKFNRFLKSLLIGTIPMLAVYVVIFTSSFSLDRHYMLCLLPVVMALYFDKKLLLVYGGILNALLIAVFALRPEQLLGPDHNVPYFLSVFFMLNGELVVLFFLTKWGREIIDNVEKSKAELQGVFDKLQTSSTAQEKRAKYMEEGVQSLLASMDKLSQGELDLALSLKEPGEETLKEYALLDSIGAKFHESVASIRGYIGEIASVLAEVSAGNLSAEVTSEFKGDFMELKTSINSIVASLNTVLTDINIAAEQVAAG